MEKIKILSNTRCGGVWKQILIKAEQEKLWAKENWNDFLFVYILFFSASRYPVHRQNDKSLYGTIHVGIHKVKIRNAFNQKTKLLPSFKSRFYDCKRLFFLPRWKYIISVGSNNSNNRIFNVMFPYSEIEISN